MKYTRIAALIAAIAAPGLSHAVVGSSAPQYVIQDLGVVSPNLYSQTFGMSSTGNYVVGRNLLADGVSGSWPAFQWSAGTGMVALGYLSGHNYAWDRDVNTSGVSVGWLSVSTTGAGAVPTKWVNGVATQLNMLGMDVGHVYGINDNGIAVGSLGSDVNEQAAIFNTVSGKTTLISALSPQGSYMATATAISNTGLVAGVGVDGSNHNVAMLYNANNNTMMELAMPATGGVATSLAFSISANGQYVVGSNASQSQPFIWSASTGALIQTLPGISSVGTLYGINDSGWAVGNSGGVYSNPFLVANGATYLVGDLITNGADWNFATTTSASAMGIAADGSIVGTAQFNGVEHAYLATLVAAVPEPSSYALMLAGAAVIGVATRRRRKADAAA